MPKRVQSPSSINTHEQCPRKYFYQYVLKFPTKENIHCVRGNIVHESLEKFYDIDMNAIDQDKYKQELSFYMKNLFDACWKNAAKRLQKVGLPDEKLDFYFNESMHMLANWLNHFFSDMDKETKKGASITDAFNKLKPISIEKQYKDADLAVRGYVDAIHQVDDHVTVLDYKTSKNSDMKPAYILQLGIYAVLYEKEHGKYPQSVSIWFLKDCQKTISVTPKLVKDALFEMEQIHFATESDQIEDYKKKESPLCKWSTGQCDFYDICKKQS